MSAWAQNILSGRQALPSDAEIHPSSEYQPFGGLWSAEGSTVGDQPYPLDAGEADMLIARGAIDRR